VQSLAVERGARVQPGAPLFQLDTDMEVLARDEAAARLTAARAQTANLTKARRPDEIRAAEAQLQQAQAALHATDTQLARTRELVQREFLARSALDDLSAERDRASARVNELEAQLRLTRAAARPDEIAAARAQAHAEQAALAQQAWRQTQKAQSAPAAGVVFDIMYRAGERVPAGNPVVALLPDGALKLRFYVPQASLASVHIGDEVELHCDGCAQGLAARIAFVSPTAEFTPPVIYSNESRQKLVFLVEARPLGDTAALLKPGQPVDVVPRRPV
jgi:HlyD family secretion protein